MPSGVKHKEKGRKQEVIKKADGSSRRVVAYDRAVALEICELISEGQTLKAICDDKAMPHRSTFNRWVVQEPELARAYSAARELSAYALEDEALGLARELVEQSTYNSAKVRSLDIAMNQLRWSASKRNAKVFSDRAQTQFTVPIQINTTMDLGGGAGGQSTDEHPNVYQATATIVEGGELEEIVHAEEMVKDTAPLRPEKGRRRKRSKRLEEGDPRIGR